MKRRPWRPGCLDHPPPGRALRQLQLFERVETFVREVAGVTCGEQLSDAVLHISRELGFAYFALTQHADPATAGHPFIRLDNYPTDWAIYFDDQQLATCDPVHRASGLTSVGFAWSDLPSLIDLTRRDHEILQLAGLRGVGNGFTVPAHIPGEINGSCSFAVKYGTSFPSANLPAAQLVGAFAFEAARRLWKIRLVGAGRQARLTDRQRDCVLWASRGKSDWEIGRILGVSHETVIQHLKQARERYGVTKRTQLTVRALFDGTLSFRDILPP